MHASFDLSSANWFKSSYSNGQGGACTLCAHLPGGHIAVRDSKAGPDGPVLVFNREQWSTFIQGIKAGELGEGSR